jgi:hypothetical protein
MGLPFPIRKTILPINELLQCDPAVAPLFSS